MKKVWYILLLVIACLVLTASPASAGSIAMSGNFYMVDLQVKQGETVAYSSTYVVIFNYNDYPLDFNMETTQPTGVNMELSQYSGTIPAKTGENPTYVLVYLKSIIVGKKVKPGDYPVSILATATISNVGNIVIVGGVEMSNTLTVTALKSQKTVKRWRL